MDADVTPHAHEYTWREATRVGVRAVAIIAAYFVLPFERSLWLVTLLIALVLVGLFPFALRRFQRVLRSEHPIVDAVNGLLVSLVALLVSFAALYVLLATRDPASMLGIKTKVDALYFETTMLSTVGFGDVTAASQLARGLVTVNMVMNMVYLGTTVRLLTWAVRKREIS